MSISRISGRYAKSLLDLAISGNKVEKVLGDITSFSNMLESRDLELLLNSPIVSAGKKESIFKALFDGKFDELTMAFFNIILKKGREQYLPQIAADFIQQYKDTEGITDVTLTTAGNIPDSVLEEIKAKLLSSNATDKSVDLISKVDPDLIGGFVIEIGDTLYDNSIAHKLNDMKKQFSSDSI
jgi:F-type H+-transporting ATPase subunit delta